MAYRRVSDRHEAAYERFRLLGVERFEADPTLAMNHGRSRNSRVVEVLAYMARIRTGDPKARQLAKIPTVTCEAAVRQFFKASDGMQAAHLLPGQIMIDGLLPWAYLSGDPGRLLENLFGYVEPLDANFNKADSAAEANGLATAFADACEAVLTSSEKPVRAVEGAYSLWISGALAAFAAASAQKRTRPTPPDIVYGEPGTPDYNTIMNLEERGEAFADDDLWNIYEQISILDYYAAVMEELPRELAPASIVAIAGDGSV